MILSFEGDLSIRQQLTDSVPTTLDTLEEVMASSPRGNLVMSEHRTIEREIRDLIEENSPIAVTGNLGDLDEPDGVDLGNIDSTAGIEAAVRVAFYRVRDFAESRKRDAAASLDAPA